MNAKSSNTVWYTPTINRKDRELLHRHKSSVLHHTVFISNKKRVNKLRTKGYLLTRKVIELSTCGTTIYKRG